MCVLPHQHRLILLDAMDVMQHAQTVINCLYPKDDKTPDALCLPIITHQLFAQGANVRIFITSHDYENRQNFRNFAILERLYCMELLVVEANDPVTFRGMMLLKAEKYGAIIVSRNTFHNICPYHFVDVSKHVRQYEMTNNPNFKKEDLLNHLVVENKMVINFVPGDKFVVTIVHPDFIKVSIGTVEYPMYDHTNDFELMALLDQVHFNLSNELLKQSPTFIKKDDA